MSPTTTDVEELLAQSTEDFASLDTSAQLTAVFALLQEQANSTREAVAKVEALHEHIRTLEADARSAIGETMKKFGGGMLGGLF